MVIERISLSFVSSIATHQSNINSEGPYLDEFHLYYKFYNICFSVEYSFGFVFLNPPVSYCVMASSVYKPF
jgi:hypothetical protein